MQRLRQSIDRLDEMLAEGLRAIVERELAATDDARHRAQPRELFLQVVVSLGAAHEYTRFLGGEMRFFAHGGLRSPSGDTPLDTLSPEEQI